MSNQNRRLKELTALAGLTEAMNQQQQAGQALAAQGEQRDMEVLMKMLGYTQQQQEQEAAASARDRALALQEQGLTDERAYKDSALQQNNAQFNRKAVLDMVDQMLARGETLDVIQPFLEQIPEFATGFQKRAEGQRQAITNQVRPIVENAYKNPATVKKTIDALYQTYGATPVGRQALDNLSWGEYNAGVPVGGQPSNSLGVSARPLIDMALRSVYDLIPNISNLLIDNTQRSIDALGYTAQIPRVPSWYDAWNNFAQPQK